ncbi:epidermal retinol dehydrogenase 2-like [Acanthaster planci]|uniref:Short-chain dehydrogenase/reductase 3 n=1 Tax=Acanthaster planci TaxID=133434 RepID=A0A8B7YB59_ACAPL|nr:epidermal retinol dehydrogenase 2-like [Acanthaster planci]XP_022089621.1 epidermal retinol dehydrogenase 2-like [Acanthaster planci]
MGLFRFFLAIWYILVGFVKFLTPRFLRKRKDVSGEIVLITGGGMGMGRLYAIEFAKRDANVVLWDVNTAANEETSRMIQAFDGRVSAYTVDVTNADEVYKTAAKVKAEIGDVTILVNNAGVVTGKLLLDCPDHLIRRTMDVNATSHHWILKAFLPAMMANNRGHIVTVASLCGYFPVKRMVDYCASKFAAVGLHKTLRLELLLEGYDGINMTLVCPAYVSTGMFEGVTAEFLAPEYVVSQVMDGVLLNDQTVFVPRYAPIMMLLDMIVPEELSLMAQRSSGMAASMDTFTGRNKND